MFNTLRWSEWGAQYLSLLFSSCCFLAMLLLLSHFDGEAVVTWQGVTLNAVVSILSVAMKAAIAYTISECMAQWKWILFARDERPLIDFDRIDEATRGPLGSLRVIFRTKRAFAVQFGAVLTVLAVALDPLAQQLIRLNSQVAYISTSSSQIKPDLIARNSRAETYSMGAVTFNSGSSTSNKKFMTTKTPLSMQAAVLNGLSRSPKEAEQETLVQCTTGNCTFDQFSTLGICHRCNNLTSELKRVDKFGRAYVALQDTSFKDEIPVTAYALPNGHFIANPDSCPVYNGLFADCKNPKMTSGGLPVVYTPPWYTTTTFGTGNANKTNSMKDIRTMLWSMSIIYPDVQSLNKTGKFTPGETQDEEAPLWPDIPMKAEECALYYCVKTVDSSIQGNRLHELISEATGSRRRPGSWERKERPETKNENSLPEDEIGTLEFNETWSYATYTPLVIDFPNNKTEPLYTIAPGSVMSLSAYMQSLFRKDLTTSSSYQTELTEALGPQAVGINGFSSGPELADLSMEATPPALDGIWTWSRQNTSRVFYTLATSMTNEMRRNWGVQPQASSLEFHPTDMNMDQDGILNYYGKAGVLVILYDIKWGWIALHGFILVCAIVFMGLTMGHWRGKGGWRIPLWKSSSLAAIRHGREVGSVLERSSTVGDMESKAKTYYVRVGKEESEGELEGLGSTGDREVERERLRD